MGELGCSCHSSCHCAGGSCSQTYHAGSMLSFGKPFPGWKHPSSSSPSSTHQAHPPPVAPQHLGACKFHSPLPDIPAPIRLEGNGTEQLCPPIPAHCQGALGKARSRVAWKGCSAPDALQPPLTPACRNELHTGGKGQRCVISWGKGRRSMENADPHQVPCMIRQIAPPKHHILGCFCINTCTRDADPDFVSAFRPLGRCLPRHAGYAESMCVYQMEQILADTFCSFPTFLSKEIIMQLII